MIDSLLWMASTVGLIFTLLVLHEVGHAWALHILTHEWAKFRIVKKPFSIRMAMPVHLTNSQRLFILISGVNLGVLVLAVVLVVEVMSGRFPEIMQVGVGIFAYLFMIRHDVDTIHKILTRGY